MESDISLNVNERRVHRSGLSDLLDGHPMTAFNTDGFLSDEIGGYEADFADRYRDKWALSLTVNRTNHKFIFAIQVQTDRLPDLLLAALLARQSSTFQAFLLLARKGLIDQSEMIVRTLAETMFIAGAICKDHAFAKTFVLSDEISRKRSLIRLNKDRERRGEPPDPEAVALIAELQTKIQEEKLDKPTTERIAELAGLSSYYDSLYGLFSMAVHSSTRSLDKALKADSTGKVIAIEYGPATEGFDLHFDYAVSMTLYVLHEVASHFGLDVTEIEALQRRNDELAGKGAPRGKES